MDVCQREYGAESCIVIFNSFIINKQKNFLYTPPTFYVLEKNQNTRTAIRDIEVIWIANSKKARRQK